jgi:Cu-Zn family superoxide dismutase
MIYAQTASKTTVKAKQYDDAAYALQSVPVDVRGAAQRALMWKRQGYKGATETGLRRAKQLSESPAVTLETLADMRTWFARHGPDAKNGGTSYGLNRESGGGYWKFATTGVVGKGAVAWECWGGDAAYLWLKSPEIRRKLARVFKERRTASAEIRIVQFRKATCAMMRGGTSVNLGTIEAYAVGGTKCRLVCDLHGLGPGLHGLHVHECAPRAQGDCASACAHYNPDGSPHGGPDDPVGRRHRGDFGNILADKRNGKSKSQITAEMTLHELIGRSIVVHEDADDLGRGEGRSEAESRRTGNAGKRIACGIVLGVA